MIFGTFHTRALKIEYKKPVPAKHAVICGRLHFLACRLMCPAISTVFFIVHCALQFVSLSFLLSVMSPISTLLYILHVLPLADSQGSAAGLQRPLLKPERVAVLFQGTHRGAHEPQVVFETAAML